MPLFRVYEASRTEYHEEIRETGDSAAQVCRGSTMGIIVLFQSTSCAVQVQWVIVLVNRSAGHCIDVLTKICTYSYEACPVYQDIKGDLLAYDSQR